MVQTRYFIFFALFTLLSVLCLSAHAELYYAGRMDENGASNYSLAAKTALDEVAPDADFSASGVVGSDIGPSSRAELELGYRMTSLNKLKLSAADPGPTDRDVRTISLTGNIYYDFLDDQLLRPFVGVGFGGANISADDGAVAKGNENVFAYQLAAGGSFATSETVSLDLQYRYFGTQDLDLSRFKREFDTHSLFFGLRLAF